VQLHLDECLLFDLGLFILFAKFLLSNSTLLVKEDGPPPAVL
jgi:hypothetical protein